MRTIFFTQVCIKSYFMSIDCNITSNETYNDFSFVILNGHSIPVKYVNILLCNQGKYCIYKNSNLRKKTKYCCFVSVNASFY